MGVGELNHDNISCHKLRRGVCTFYLDLGRFSLEQLRVLGDWSSDAIIQYIKIPLMVRILDNIRVSSLLCVVSI